jgi:phage terminase Nu1 subunit (DNA packaging protein)
MLSDSTCSKDDIAELFNVSERYINRLAVKKIIPKEGRGQFKLKPTIKAYITYLRGQKNNMILDNMNELEHRLLQAQTQEREAKASMADLELSVMEGRLHEAEHVRKIMTDMIVACRSRLLAIPSRASTTLAYMTAPPDIVEYLQGLVYEALNALADYDPEQFNEMNENYIPPTSIEDDDDE